MKKTIRFGYLFALLAVSALFACNQNEEDDNIVVNDSPFVGTWNLKSMATSNKVELLDSLGKVFETLDPYAQTNVAYPKATIEFKEDYTALSIIRDGDDITTGAYKWEDLGEKMVLKSYATYQKVQIDTFDISKSGNAVTFKTLRKSKSKFNKEEIVQVNDSTQETEIKTYDSNVYTTVTINIDK